MLSRWLVRLTGIATLCLALSAAASAQYGGGGTGGTGATGSGTPGYVAPSGGYGSGKAIGIGVGAAAGAAVAVILLVRHHHHTSSQAQTQTYVTGCTQSIQDGVSLTNEKDNQTYSLITDSKSVKTGERVALKGIIVPTEGSGNPVFHAQSLIKDYGACGATSASNSTSQNSTTAN